MTVDALQQLITQEVATALKARAIHRGADMRGIRKHLQESYRHAAEHETFQGKAARAEAKGHRALAKAAEARADVTSQKVEETMAELKDRIAANHEEHAARLSAKANPNHGMWNLSEWTVGSNGEPVGGPADKVAKADNFFDKFMYGAPPKVAAIGDMFK